MDPFNNLYNAILNNQQNQLNDIITFISTPKGEKIQKKIELFFRSILKQYKSLYKQFKDVRFQFDLFSDNDLYIYGEVFPQHLNIIRINLYPFLLDYYYNQTSLKEIFNKIKNGTYEGMEGPLVEHQLAHILDFKGGKKLTRQNVHGKSWKQYLKLLKDRGELNERSK